MTDTLRQRLANCNRPALMTADMLRAKMTDPRYTHAQKRAHLFHAAAHADDASDDELLAVITDLFAGLSCTRFDEFTPN